MERVFDDRPNGGKDWAFFNIYPHLHRLEKAATDLADEVRLILLAEEDGEHHVPDYSQISAFARRAAGEIQHLRWYANHLAEPEREQFFHQFRRMGAFYDEAIEACRDKERGHLKDLFDCLACDAQWISIEIERLAIAAFGQLGAFNGAADDPLNEFYPLDFRPDELAELVRAARGFGKADVFVITPLQERILKALHGRALKKESLAEEVCKGQGRMLYKPGGINELKERGLVKHRKGVGYYRPDAPPPNAV